MEVSAAIVKYLCANFGSVNREELVANCVFGDATTVSAVINNRERFAVGTYNGEKMLIAKTSLRLCRRRDCPGCSCLHLCKTYLYGECQFVPGRQVACAFSHDLRSEYNYELLQTHDLAHLDKKELCVLLLQNDAPLLPPVCHDYNNGEGPHGRCNESCTRIHFCENYLHRSCACFRTHDFQQPQPLQALQKSRIPAAMMGAMKPLYINKKVLASLDYRARNKAGGAPAGEASGSVSVTPAVNPRAPRPGGRGAAPQDKTEICLFFLKGHCKHETGRCFKAHLKLPYSWEVQEGNQWTVLDSSEQVEKDFCNPKKTYSTVEMVCFDTMTRGLQKARRLSSVSSVLQPTFLLTTEWLWYWEDENGNWNQYESPTNANNSSITSAELEEKFQNNPQEAVDFTAGSQAYTLSFQDMKQTNQRYGTMRRVRRRPAFMSPADVQTARTSKRPSHSVPNFQDVPRHWDKTQVPETGHKKVLLQKSSDEYKEVEKLFCATMTGFDILSIERIQNKNLWDHFKLQSDQMRKKNGGRGVAERKLFHGTNSKHVEAICRSNFDWRICGTHGTAYGKGSYFATDASYSHSYTEDSGSRAMFVSRVLVGHHTKGSPSYLRPPSKDGGDALFYDSCADSVRTPSIFVVFDMPQIYPEYLLTYREKAPAYNDYLSDWGDFRQAAAAAVVAAIAPPAPVAPKPAAAHPVHRATPTYPAYSSSPPAQRQYSTPSYPSPKPKTNDSCVVS